MARRLPPCHCPEWLATVKDIGQIYGWWLGEVDLTFDPLSTLPLSVYPWREDSHHAIAQSGWRLPFPRPNKDINHDRNRAGGLTNGNAAYPTPDQPWRPATAGNRDQTA